jgi:hypothetical protein
MSITRFLALTLALSLGTVGPLTLRAELPPSAYEALQREAPEVLRINVLTVSTEKSSAGEAIEMLAEVLTVGRSDTLKVGDIITIRYERTNHPAGWVGPGEVPVPEEKAETVAYLKLAADGSDYEPAAGMMTFRSF